MRVGRALSLRQVTVRSGGRFKPSSVASYERGERMISLERLFALAEVYEVAPERIVAAIAHRVEGGFEGPSEEEPEDSVLVLDPFGPGASRAR